MALSGRRLDGMQRILKIVEQVVYSILPHGCQEIGLVAFMFFFELLFSMLLSQFPSMFLLLIYFQSFILLSADYLRHSR